MGENLPDGVTTSDIPGFRPRDENFEKSLKSWLKSDDAYTVWCEYLDYHDSMCLCGQIIENDPGHAIHHMMGCERAHHWLVDHGEQYLVYD